MSICFPHRRHCRDILLAEGEQKIGLQRRRGYMIAPLAEVRRLGALTPGLHFFRFADAPIVALSTLDGRVSGKRTRYRLRPALAG
jgi:hypothetical protein